MTIAGHHPGEEDGNNMILVTLILRHTPAITPEAHKRLGFHLRHLRPTLANPIENTSITNKVLPLTTMAPLRITTARLHINRMVVMHLEEAFEGPRLHLTSDSRLWWQHKLLEDRTCAIFLGRPKLEQEVDMLPRSMERLSRRKLKVRHPQAMPRTISVGLIILSAQLLKTCELTMRQGKLARVNFKLSLLRTRTLNQNSPKVRKSDLAYQRRASLQLQWPNLMPSW